MFYRLMRFFSWPWLTARVAYLERENARLFANCETANSRARELGEALVVAQLELWLIKGKPAWNDGYTADDAHREFWTQPVNPARVRGK